MKVAGNTLALNSLPIFGSEAYVTRAASAAETSFEQHKPPEYIPPNVWQAYFRPFSGDLAEMKSQMYRASYDLSLPPYTWDSDNSEAAKGPGMNFYYPWEGDRVLVHVDSQQGYPFLARGLVMMLRNEEGFTGDRLRNIMLNHPDTRPEQFTFSLRLQHPSVLMRGMHRLFFYKGPQLELTGDQWTVWRKEWRCTFGPSGPFPI
jgi:hypothetical protein